MRQFLHQFQLSFSKGFRNRLSAGHVLVEGNHQIGSAPVSTGQSELIEKQLLQDHPIRSNVRAMRGAVDRIEAVAGRTLGFSRRNNDVHDSCDLETVVNDAHRFVEPYLKARNVWFQFSPPRERVSLAVSGGRLAQVFVNLFQNAIDAMTGSPERALRVRVIPSNDEVRIEVEDTGKGIPDKDLEHVFEQFFTTKAPQGTGLGLYITRQIVEDMNGAVSVENGNQTTTFTVGLPRSYHLPSHPLLQFRANLRNCVCGGGDCPIFQK
jgi:signal transduction histidine kinase